MKKHRDTTRGAALIVAILVLAILLIIVLSFFNASRQEQKIARNVLHQTQAELIAEGGTAIAIAFLNHDRQIHPTVTSIDHAWKTYWNGSWAVGKPWMWKRQPVNTWPDGRVPLVHSADAQHGRNVPEVDWDLLNPLVKAQPIALYVPRIDDQLNPANATPLAAYDSTNHPFVYANDVAISPLYTELNLPGEAVHFNRSLENPQLAQEQIDQFADIDLSGDGFRDAVWVPMPIDRIFDNDGIDNNLNYNPITGEGVDEPGETALFVYWGGNDGLDNNGNGDIDELDEQRLYLTAPLRDQNGDVVNVTIQFRDGENLNLARLLEYAGVDSISADRLQVVSEVGHLTVDRLDNDHDLIINNSPGYLYNTTGLTAAQVIQHETRRFHVVSHYYFPGAAANDVISFRGEPVCDIAGRFAVLVNDESGKVNLNAAGGRTFRTAALADTTLAPLTRTINLGLSPHEYETRAIPDIGVAHSDHLRNLIMGAPRGIGYRMAAPNTNAISPGAAGALGYDASLPGYGRVDDTGSALWMSLTALDYNGDGIVGAGIVSDFWQFEGIDDHQEYLYYRPLRNHIAENNNQDDDYLLLSEIFAGVEPELVDQIGEIGDRYLRSIDQVKLVHGLAAAAHQHLRPLATAHSADRNDRFRFAVTDEVNTQQRIDRYPFAATLVNGVLQPTRPHVSGFKLDYNYSYPHVIAGALSYDWGYGPVQMALPGTPHWTQAPVWFRAVDGYAAPAVQEAAAAFAAGLRREHTSIADRGVDPAERILAGSFHGMPSDDELRAAQYAVSIRDDRDRNHARTELGVSAPDLWWEQVSDGDQRTISYTQSGIESVRINEIMVRPVRRIEAESLPPAGVTSTPWQVSEIEALFDTPDLRLRFDPNLNNAFGFVSGRQPVDPQWPEFDAYASRVNENGWIFASAAPTQLGDRSSFVSRPEATLSNPSRIEFVFAPSPGLPPAHGIPARYYLLMNTTWFNPATNQLEPTVSGLGQFRFAITTAARNQHILDTQGPIPWRTDYIVGYRPAANAAGIVPTGYVLLLGDGPGGTVEIPPYAATDQPALHVAIEKIEEDNNPATPSAPLAINFFDFSQEPDHEWIELVNTAEHGAPIEIGGWQVMVGAPTMATAANGVVGPTIMTVPADTRIAPGGSVLLAVNKFDYHDYRGGPVDATRIPVYQRNGMGLARGGLFEFTTEPAIPGFYMTDAGPVMLGESLFLRGGDDIDFIDRDGDGLADATTVPDYSVESTTVATTFPAFGHPHGPNYPAYPIEDPATPNTNRAWNRIVEVQIDSLRTANSIYELVLAGGIFPNYPEHDGIDNDGDVPILMSDGIDNTGDGLVDQVGYAGDEPRREGIDEGRWNLLPPGVGNTTAPRYHNAFDPANPYHINTPGSFMFHPADPNANAVNYTFNLDPNLAPANTRIVTPTAAPNVGAAPYIGIASNDPAWLPFSDPPQWKAFAEKRWYPGDKVIVTLFEGSAQLGRVVDRITYSEQDVINRSIDDVLPTNGARTPLDARYPGTWPANTMGLDFYRSLERTHPLYSGDTHGTTNRWQATDGNYDDWSPSTSLWEYVVNQDYALVSLRPRGGFAAFGHAFHGSPLRKNMGERVLNNPNDHFPRAMQDLSWAFEFAQVRNNTYASPGDLVRLPSLHFTDTLASARDAGTGSLHLISPVPVNVAFNVNGTEARQDLVFTPVTPTGVQASLDGVMPGQAFPVDAGALLTNATNDSLVLTAAQANFYPMAPGPLDYEYAGGAYTDPTLRWDNLGPYPSGWVPIFLHPLPNSGSLAYPTPPLRDAAYRAVPQENTMGGFAPTYPLHMGAYSLANIPIANQLNYLFNEPRWPDNTPLLPAGMTSFDDLALRWPLERRIVAYASGNTGSEPAQALFEWDAASGLENGEYDVYIVTCEDLRVLRLADAAAAAQGYNYLSDFARQDFLPALDSSANRQMRVDVEIFTDRDADRRSWNDLGDNYPTNVAMDRGNLAADPNDYGDSFGIHYAAVPDEDGLIHYGLVRVENNYLALRIRNVAERGLLNRFSRVVLAPRHRTPGRININSASTVITEASAATPHVFNPLMGVPGVMGGYLGTAGFPDQLVNTIYPRDLDNVDPYPLSALGALPLPNENTHPQHRARKITAERPQWADGRYFRSPADLVTPVAQSGAAAVYPPFLTNLDVANPRDRFDELSWRYTRLANLVTTRSDVFEIVVMAQTGFISNEDLNGDGRIDYRNDFVVTGESRKRTVYQR